MPVLNDLPSCDQAKILELRMKNIVQPRELTRIANSIRIPYYLEDDEIVQLEKFLGRYVTLDNGQGRVNGRTYDRLLLRSSHPVAASINFFANQEAYREAQTYGRFIDIGSDIRRNNKQCHSCNLIDGVRDANRYLMQANSMSNQLGQSIEENLMDGRRNQIDMCFNGTQRCNIKAKCAISVNSLYDIPIEDISLIFNQHNIDILIAYMFLPLELIDQNVSKCNDDKFYKVQINGKLAHFKFKNDYSFIYTHDHHNWARYLKTTLIKCDTFNIVIEIQRTYGPLHKLVFRRVPVYSKVVAPIRCIPVGDYSQFVKVPNMRYVVARNFDAKFSEIPMLVVQRSLAVNLYKFVTKAPDGPFCYERGASYFHGMSSRLTIGKTVVVKESNLTPVEYDDVLFSIMFLSAIARLRRTQSFGYCMKNVDKSFSYEITNQISKFRLLKNALVFAKNGFYDWFTSYFYTNEESSIRYEFNEESSRDFMMFTFSFFEDYDFNEIVDCTNIKPINYINRFKNNFCGNKRIPMPKRVEKVAEPEEEDSTDDENFEDCYDEQLSVKNDQNDGQLTDDEISNLQSDEYANNQLMLVDQEPPENDEPFLTNRLIKQESEEPLFSELLNELDVLNHAIGENDSMYDQIRILERNEIKKYKSRGQAKIDEIIEHSFKKKRFESIHEISIAPGFFGQILSSRTMHLYGHHYTGENSVAMKQYNKKFYKKIYDFKNLDDVVIENADLIVCDVGDENHSDLIEQQFDLVRGLKRGGSLVLKTWVDFDISKCQVFFEKFDRVELYKPVSSFSINHEYYVICTGLNSDKIKAHDDWKIQYYVIIKRIIAYHEMYLSNQRVDNIGVKPSELMFEKIKINLSAENARKFLSDYKCADSDDAFYELNLKATKELNKILINDTTIEVNVHNAVFGSGKSSYIKNNAAKIKSKGNDLVVVPTRELKQHYRNLGYNCMTYTSALISKGNYNNVFFDECFMVPKHYYYFFTMINRYDNLYLFGDSNQIGNVDFNMVGYNNNDVIHTSGYQDNVSMRVPQDVCNILKDYQIDCKTTNKQRLSVFFENRIHRLLEYVNSGVKIMTFRQAMKDLLHEQYKNHEVKSIHERQGGSYPVVVWIMEPGDEMTNFTEHLRVALTRHYNALIIYGSESCKEMTLNIYNTPIETISERIMVPLFDHDKYEDTTVTVKKVTDRPFFDKCKIGAWEMLGKIDKIIDVYGRGIYFNALRKLDLPNVYQGKASFNFNVFSKLDRNVKGKSLLPYNTCRVYDSRDQFETVRTLIGRYGLKTNLLDCVDREFNVQCLTDGLDKFLLHPRGSVEYNKHFMFDYEDMCTHFFDYIEALNKKNLAAGELDMNMDQFMHENGPRMISFFMKKQTKFDTTENFFDREKFGQGVNAWHKLMNVIFACYARSFSKKLKSFLKPNVFYQNGESDIDLGNNAAFHINNYYNEYNCYPIQVDNDFTEYDASQNASTIKFETLLLDDLGLTDECIELYRQHRSEWKTYYPSYASLTGVEKKHSGEPFTIDFNTSLNMAICGYIYDIDKLVVAQFKGDDSNIMAHNVSYTKEGDIFLKKLGFKTKMVIKNVSEFTGLIQTRYGPYPDLIRRLIKAFSKVFKDEESFEEFKLSVHDCISTIDNISLQHEGRTFLAYYYNEILLTRNSKVDLFTAEDIADIEDFMFNFRNYKYEDLVDHMKDSVTISSEVECDSEVTFVM